MSHLQQHVSMVSMVAMATKEFCNSLAMQKNAKFIFGSCLTWDKVYELAYLVAMEIQLPWQQGNFATTMLNESILGSNLAHTFFVIIGNTCLPDCSGNTVAMATRKLYNNSAI